MIGVAPLDCSSADVPIRSNSFATAEAVTYDESSKKVSSFCSCSSTWVVGLGNRNFNG